MSEEILKKELEIANKRIENLKRQLLVFSGQAYWAVIEAFRENKFDDKQKEVVAKYVLNKLKRLSV